MGNSSLFAILTWIRFEIYLIEIILTVDDNFYIELNWLIDKFGN